MAFDLLTAEQEAIQSLSDLIAQAKRCQALHERARMTLPEPLKRMLGLSTNGSGKVAVANVSPPERPPLPIGAGSDWVSIPATAAYPQSLILAFLRNADAPVPVAHLIASAQAIQPDIRKGSIHNIGTRLERNELITRSKEGWELLTPEEAPILDQELIWAPAKILTMQELAAHRREAVLHLLKTFRTGLQTSQLIEVLQNCPWVHAPVSKELVQDDVELLSKAPAKIKRRGASKKWEVIAEKN
jgi:hypothetical protein